MHDEISTSTEYLYLSRSFLSIQLVLIMSGGFFGFGDSALPERRDRPPHQQPSQQPQYQQQQQQFSGFASANTDDTFGAGAFGNKGEDEDLAVYTWGQGGNLLEGADDLNDETFGDFGDVGVLLDPLSSVVLTPGNDFQFSSQPAAPPVKQKIASTASRYKPKAAYDPFAASEDDFYAARPATKSEYEQMGERWRYAHGRIGKACFSTEGHPCRDERAIWIGGEPVESAQEPAAAGTATAAGRHVGCCW